MCVAGKHRCVKCQLLGELLIDRELQISQLKRKWQDFNSPSGVAKALDNRPADIVNTSEVTPRLLTNGECHAKVLCNEEGKLRPSHNHASDKQPASDGSKENGATLGTSNSV